jgi:hypothetical protein
MSGEVSYRTHILIGVRPNGVMTVIADWPHVPKQTDVQQEIDAARNGYVTFALCTPTSSCRRRETIVREDEDGIGPLGQAGGEQGLRLQSKATVVPL